MAPGIAADRRAIAIAEHGIAVSVYLAVAGSVVRRCSTPAPGSSRKSGGGVSVRSVILRGRQVRDSMRSR